MSGYSEPVASKAAWLLPFMAAVAWGGMFPVAKQALSTLDPVNLTLLRYGAVALMLVGVVAAQSGIQALRPTSAGRLFVLGTVGILGFNVLMLLGLRHTSSERAATVMATLPFATVVIRWAMEGKRPHVSELMAFAVALGGVALLVTRGDLSALWLGKVGRGEGLVALAVLCWAVYTYGAGSVKGVTGLRYAAFTTLYGSVSLAGLSAFLSLTGYAPFPSLAAVAAADWELGYMITFAGIVAIVAWSSGVRRLGAGNTAFFINFIPVTAFIWGGLDGRSYTSAEVAGAGMIVVAAVALNLYRRRTQP